MPAPQHKARRPTASTGDFEETSFAELLMGLARDRFSGAIDLERDEVRKQILFQRGLPVMAESNLSTESLSKALLDAGHLDPAQHRKVGEAVRAGRMSEGAAVLALECVEASQLLKTLRSVTRRRIVECFEWSRGEFREARDVEPPENANALRYDPVSLALEGIAVHWSPKRVREALAGADHRYPHPTPGTANLIERLGADPDTRARCEALDGSETLAAGLADASTVAWAAALVLERLGAWELRGTPWSAEAGEAEGENAPAALPEYDIVIGSVRGSAREGSDRAGASRQQQRVQAGPSDEAETFRAEIETLHRQLEDLDHYAILGVEPKDGIGPIKRAYFKLAKRFHPDVLARLGLEEVKEQAKEIFARIATAYEVLKDPNQRRDYDASRSGDAGLDASRLIQAESLFRKGEILLGAGNFAGALEFLKPAVELWPEETEYQCGLGWALFRKSPPDLGGAREHLELAVQHGPKNAVAHQRLGMVLRSLEDFAGAESALARAKALDPSL